MFEALDESFRTLFYHTSSFQRHVLCTVAKQFLIRARSRGSFRA